MAITIEELKDLARRLKFEMNEEEYRTLQDEFKTIIKQLDLISEVEDLDSIEPMTFPYFYNSLGWREDEVEPPLSVDDVLKNAPQKAANMIKVKKVV